MNAAPAPLWSAEQCAWLRALGHDVPVRVAEVQDEPAAVGSAAIEPALRTAAGTGASRATAAHPAAPAVADSPLLRALARAAGRPVHDPDLLSALPGMESLRGNPAARRALWPLLRALRRQGRP